jgi:hypothetical protein
MSDWENIMTGVVVEWTVDVRDLVRFNVLTSSDLSPSLFVMPEPARSSPGCAIIRSDWSLRVTSRRQRAFRLLRLHARRATLILAPTTSTISTHLLCLSQTTLRASSTAPVTLNLLSLLVFARRSASVL